MQFGGSNLQLRQLPYALLRASESCQVQVLILRLLFLLVTVAATYYDAFGSVGTTACCCSLHGDV
jgi:hypothetical protein